MHNSSEVLAESEYKNRIFSDRAVRKSTGINAALHGGV